MLKSKRIYIDRKADNKKVLDTNASVNDLVKKAVLEYSSLVRFLAFSALGSREEANEITQEVFYKLYEVLTLTRFKNIKYWLVSTTRNMTINRLKSKGRLVLLDDDTDTLCTFYQAYELYSESKEDIFGYLVACLDAFEIEILTLHLCYGLTFKEIAFELEKTVDTINSKYRRSLSKFKNYIKTKPELCSLYLRLDKA